MHAGLAASHLAAQFGLALMLALSRRLEWLLGLHLFIKTIRTNIHEWVAHAFIRFCAAVTSKGNVYENVVLRMLRLFRRKCENRVSFFYFVFTDLAVHLFVRRVFESFR